jgi:hypothetical protein
MKIGFLERTALIYVLSVLAAGTALGEPRPQALAGFNSYVAGVESRLAAQHRSRDGFLAPANEERLRRGEMVVEQLTPPDAKELPGAMLHDWRGTAFAPGAKAADFERLMLNFNDYPKYFAPQVVKAKVLSQEGDRMEAFMRVRQHHVITIVMDSTYDIRFGRLDPRHGYSISRSTQISEVESPGTANERALSPSEEHGFLWRLNTYWSYEERDGGLYMQVEAVSLTRSIPRGLGWLVRPFVESVPRESLEFTLHAACKAISKPS